MMLEYSSVPIFGFFFILRMDKRELLKGGAQKIREKKQKLMQDSAKHCSKITDMYNNISKPDAVKPVHDISSTPDEATTIANCTSEASTHHQKLQTFAPPTRVKIQQSQNHQKTFYNRVTSLIYRILTFCDRA